jgi:hypothetical protein
MPRSFPGMDEAAPDRMALAEILGDAFLDGTWRAEDLAERGSGCLEFWPDWMVKLSFAVLGRHRIAPVDDRDGLVRFIGTFLMLTPPSRWAWERRRLSVISKPEDRYRRTTGRSRRSGLSRRWLSGWS